MSVIVELEKEIYLITKGSPEKIKEICIDMPKVYDKIIY
jgi:magnesium-transporting ATPase (P-type)